MQDIYVWHDLNGKSAEQIVAEFPQLSLADVYAAMAYYHENRDLIQQQIREEKEFVAALKAQAGPGLLDRVRGTEANAPSVSSR